MYDPLTTTYGFACPHGRRARVPLSAFRRLELLPGAAHPAVYQVVFGCACGEEHPGLVSHDDLDWAPLGAATAISFHNLMTSRADSLAGELTDLAALRIGAGEWPWSFFCLPEGRAAADDAVGARARGAGRRCVRNRGALPVCSAVSVNLVTREHVDIPFWNDGRVGVVDHVFPADALRAVDEFRAALVSASFDEKRLELEG